MIDVTLHNDSELSIGSEPVNDLANLVLNDHGHISGKINIIVTDDTPTTDTGIIKIYIGQPSIELDKYYRFIASDENQQIKVTYKEHDDWGILKKDWQVKAQH